MAMASEGRDLSSRMSAEAQNIDNSIEKTALKLFKMHKVAISQAIRESFPLLQLLHDHDFITSEMYDVSKESFKKGHNVEDVYNILVEVEKKFDPLLLKVLFSKFTMKENPDLNHIYKIFKNEIPDKFFFLESEAEENKEMHDIQSSLEQVTISDDSAKCDDGHESPKASTPAVQRRTGTGQQPDVPVNFQAEILPITCKEERGLLIKRKMERGTTTKCIRMEEIHWLTLGEFDVRGGYKTARDRNKRLCCGGRTLDDLIEDKILRTPPRKHGANKKGEDSDKCKICLDDGKLFRCENCHSFFHVDCHLPPVDTKRASWDCTFCTIKNLPRSQQRYRESEVLKKVMGPEENLKCEFLLLKVYGHLEGNVFPNIPRENYVEEASRCLEKLRKLDEIKENLINGKYPDLKRFVQAMDKFFTILSCNDAELTKDDFKKNFKEIFAIQKTN